jgi:hypothetical protein
LGIGVGAFDDIEHSDLDEQMIGAQGALVSFHHPIG